MEGLQENEAFLIGMNVGLHLYQQKVIAAHEKGKSLLINGNLYYLQNGRERLEMLINEICQ